jgi:crotonobetainyl-CoA:carnitine CoA-transferase CaiB-like acyl-CoA transferase
MVSEPASALSRLSVLDLTRIRSGPTAVKQFADWGATVIKIEMPSDNDQDDGFTGTRLNPDFQNLHRNKRSITLNLKSPGGIEVFRKLVARADIVVENYRPDVKDRLGIDYASLDAINPRIILGSISGFGQDGPYAGRPGFDQILQGMGGMMSVTGLPGQGPVRAGTAIADLSAGLFLALGILTALYEREASGRGQWVQTSLLEAQIAMMDFQAARWLIGGEVPAQAGNFHPTNGSTGVYPTADGHINLAPSGDTIWRRMCMAMGLEHLLSDPDFIGSPKQSENRDALHAEISKVTRTRPSAEWVALLNEAGVPCGPIYDMREVFEDAQVRHLGIATPVEHPSLGPIRVVGQPIHLSRTPSRMRAATPSLGQHTDEVLAELGYDAAAIAALRDDKAI